MDKSLEKKNWYDETRLVVLVLFLVYVVAWYLQLTSRWEFLKSIRFEFLLGTVLLFCSLKKNPYTLQSSGLLMFVILFFFICFVSFLFSPDIARSWFVFYTYVIKYACFSLFIYKFVVGPKELKLFLMAIFFAWFKIGQEGLFGTITGGMMWMNQGVMRLHGPSGMYFNPNSFSGFAIGTIPFIYYFLPVVKNNIIRVLLLIQAIFSLNIILHTGSRTGYVSLLGLMLYAFLKAKKKIKYIVCIMCVSLVLIPYIPEQYIDRIDTIRTGQDKAGHSTDKRKEILRDAVAIFLDNPFGVGVGSFPQIRINYFGRFQDTHNLYLQIATNLGIQGLIVFSLLIYKVFAVLSKVSISTSCQISHIVSQGKETDLIKTDKVYRHLFDLRIMQASAEAVKMFVFARLFFGFFGHDLYEIYWWFAIGFTSSLYVIVQMAEVKTKAVLV